MKEPDIARNLPHGDQRKLELAMILAPDPNCYCWMNLLRDGF